MVHRATPGVRILAVDLPLSSASLRAPQLSCTQVWQARHMASLHGEGSELPPLTAPQPPLPHSPMRQTPPSARCLPAGVTVPIFTLALSPQRLTQLPAVGSPPGPASPAAPGPHSTWSTHHLRTGLVQARAQSSLPSDPLCLLGLPSPGGPGLTLTSTGSRPRPRRRFIWNY